MLPMLNKHALITAALMASLNLTACGSKKDLVNKDAPPTTDGSAPSTDTQKAGDTQNGNPPTGDAKTGDGKAGGSIGQTLPDPNSQVGKVPAPAGPNAPGPILVDTPVPTAPAAPVPAPVSPAAPASGKAPVIPPVVGTQSAPLPGSNFLPPDYRSNDSANVARDGLAKSTTGGVTADGLIYTSSSPDELLNFLRARNERVDEASRKANLAAAASVLSAKLNIDGMSGDAILTLKVQEGADVKVYNVSGGLNGGGTASILKSVRAGNGDRTTGTRALEGTLKCLDLDGECENMFARLKIGSPGSSAIINIVFRKSVADLYFDLPGTRSDNPEYLIVREFIKNTIQQQNSENKIKDSMMSTFEVVNGRSGVALTLKGINNELLGFAGPLLAPEAGSKVNINMSRIAALQEDSLDLISLDKAKLNYANWIGEARMVANNGLGQVKLALKMRKRSNYGQDVFTVVFMRRIKPLVELNDESLK